MIQQIDNEIIWLEIISAEAATGGVLQKRCS